jgi:hypothetical protein
MVTVSKPKWIQGKVLAQIYKDGANKFKLERKDGSTFGLMYKGSRMNDYEVGTELFATDAVVYLDGKVKVYSTQKAPVFKLNEDNHTYINREGEAQQAPMIREISTEELILSGIELMLVNTLEKDLPEVRILMQELAFQRISG